MKTIHSPTDSLEGNFVFTQTKQKLKIRGYCLTNSVKSHVVDPHVGIAP